MTVWSTTVRAAHVLTNAAWFGGSLMGAVELNPALREGDDARERYRIAEEGWRRWGPVQGVAIGLHVLQWATPTATAGLLVLDACLGEQQRGVAGLLDRASRLRRR